jgi:hypothetical protein
MTVMIFVGYCAAADKQEAIELCDSATYNWEECIVPMACGDIFGCDSEDYFLTFSQISSLYSEDEMEEGMVCDECADAFMACDEECQALMMSEENFAGCVCWLMDNAEEEWFEGMDECE